MGNHGSRRDQRSFKKHGGKAANALNRVEELRGPSVDSYDKLIAWLAEMAETDNVHLDTSVFVSQLNRVCGGGAQNVSSVASGTSVGGATAGGAGSSSVGGSSRRTPTVRQNSSSYDSHASSELLTGRHRGSSRSDDFLDPKSAWRSGGNSRQTTFSDDLEEEEAVDAPKASMESLFGALDKDCDLLGGVLAPYDVGAKKSGRGFDTLACSSSLLRACSRHRMYCENRCLMGTHISSSMGNLLIGGNGFEYSRLPDNYVKRRSVSLLNLKPPSSMTQVENIPKLVLTKEEDDFFQPAPIPELKVQRKKPKSVQKSLSLNAWTKRRGKLEKQRSLQVEPISSSFYPLPEISAASVPKPAPKEASASNAPVFLDDALLDGNLADILYCVEALWPKK